MGIDTIILFFIFGVILSLVRAPVSLPEGLTKSLMIILLLAIGLKGGLALKTHASLSLLWQCIMVGSLGILLPLMAFPLLRYFGEFDKTNAANIAAHYGSVSVGTFAVALAFLESRDIAYESYFVLFVVVLEIPAIIVGLFLAKATQRQNVGALLHELFLNPGVALLIGGLLIGLFSNSSVDKVMPLFNTLFYGVLALFLFDMGMVAAKQIPAVKQQGLFIVAFGLFMPLVGALIGGLIAIYVLDFSVGGSALLAVLCASCSYIAVPAAMRNALPEANQAASIGASLAVTFPFNVTLGIPLYFAALQWLIHSTTL